jgi:hypothetical protein
MMGAMRAYFSDPSSGRKRLLLAVLALVLVLGGVAVGTTLAVGKGGGGSDLTTASYPGFQLSFRYPSDWQRRNWCWLGTHEFPVTLLTTVHPPPCNPGNVFGFETPLPPPLRLGKDDVAAWWLTTDRQHLARIRPNTRIDGEPAQISVRQEPARKPHSDVNCAGAGPTRRSVNAQIQARSSSIGRILVGAVICGPDYAAGEAKVREMLSSLRFTS